MILIVLVFMYFFVIFYNVLNQFNVGNNFIYQTTNYLSLGLILAGPTGIVYLGVFTPPEINKAEDILKSILQDAGFDSKLIYSKFIDILDKNYEGDLHSLYKDIVDLEELLFSPPIIVPNIIYVLSMVSVIFNSPVFWIDLQFKYFIFAGLTLFSFLITLLISNNKKQLLFYFALFQPILSYSGLYLIKYFKNLN